MSELGPGTAFTLADDTFDNHLWVVISDPDANPEDEILIVNLTSWRRDREQVCVLEVRDHPFIKRRTCVNYRESRLVKREQLEKAFRLGVLQPAHEVDAAVLKRIRDGAARSSRIPMANAQLLLDQDLVD